MSGRASARVEAGVASGGGGLKRVGRLSPNNIELIQLDRETAPVEAVAARRVVIDQIDGDPSEVLAMLGLVEVE